MIGRHEMAPGCLAVTTFAISSTHSAVVTEFSDDDGENWTSVFAPPFAEPGPTAGTVRVHGYPHLAIDPVVEWLICRHALTAATAMARG